MARQFADFLAVKFSARHYDFAILRMFKDFGPPQAIRTNGGPFANAHALYGLSKTLGLVAARWDFTRRSRTNLHYMGTPNRCVDLGSGGFHSFGLEGQMHPLRGARSAPGGQVQLVSIWIPRSSERVFTECGLPAAIRTDNGVPFASGYALYGLSKLSVWWLRLGIAIERINLAIPSRTAVTSGCI